MVKNTYIFCFCVLVSTEGEDQNLGSTPALNMQSYCVAVNVFMGQLMQFLSKVVPVSNPAINLWAGSQFSANKSDHSASSAPVLERCTGVIETCIKEALTCEVSPQGYHLTYSKEKKGDDKNDKDRKDWCIDLLTTGCRHFIYICFYFR